MQRGAAPQVPAADSALHMEKGLPVTNILVDDDEPGRILGFYTLAFTEVAFAEVDRVRFLWPSQRICPRSGSRQ